MLVCFCAKFRLVEHRTYRCHYLRVIRHNINISHRRNIFITDNIYTISIFVGMCTVYFQTKFNMNCVSISVHIVIKREDMRTGCIATPCCCFTL
jgi:hypothetical protein